MTLSRKAFAVFDVVLISHGPLSGAMLESAEMICGKQTDIQAFGFMEGDSIDQFRSEVYSCIAERLKTKDVLVVTDIMCGSPFNVTSAAMQDLNFHHITGMNLPMLVQILLDRKDSSIEEVCASAIEMSECYVSYVNDLLEAEQEADDLAL